MSKIRGHSLKVRGKICRAIFFTQEVVGAWNTLLGVVVVEANTIVVFERLLDSHMDMRGLEGDGSRAGRGDCLGIMFSTDLWVDGAVAMLSCSVF